MIFALVTLSTLGLQAPTAGSAALEAETIEVVGRRLQKVKISANGGRDGSLRCAMTQSSGSMRIDTAMTDLVCDVTRQCAARKIRRSRIMKRCVQGLLEPRVQALTQRIAREDANASTTDH